jgi:hypothetical protein
VRRTTFKTDECDGNRRDLSDKCSELNRLVCSLNRRDLASRERSLCERVGLETGTGGRSRPRYEEEYDEEEYDSMDSEDEEEFDSMDSEDEAEDVFMEEE